MALPWFLQLKAVKTVVYTVLDSALCMYLFSELSVFGNFENTQKFYFFFNLNVGGHLS